MASVETCRICLLTNEGPDRQMIFTDIFRESIIEKIEICGGIKIEIREDFPDKICSDCIFALNNSYNFRQLCQLNDLKLRNISIEEEVAIKDEYSFDNASATASPIPDILSELSNDLSLIKSDGEDNVEQQQEENEKNNTSPSKTKAHKKTLPSPRRKKKKPQDIQMCEICGNVYKRRCHLMMHMKRHAALKPYVCEICNKAFGSQSQMNRHIRVHTGDKPYKCKYCDRRFSDCSTNTRHERTHTNERPFGCPTCGKTFTYSNVLKFHMMSHTGEKNYECNVCNKKFTRSHQLKHHLNTLIHQKMASRNVDVIDGNDEKSLSTIDLNVVIKKKQNSHR